jgi:P-type E1-E2 ATPase
VFSYPQSKKDELKRNVRDRVRVLARCNPDHKFAFIVALQSAGSNIAVTADGINDVKALQQADVGFCMGI